MSMTISTLPAPPPFAHVCGCGLSYGACEYLALPAPTTMAPETMGIFLMCFDDDGPDEVQLYRDCSCGSTLVEVA